MQWHLYARLGDGHTALQFPLWETAHGRLLGLVHRQLPRDPRLPMIDRLLRDAVPDQPWYGTGGEDCVIKLRPCRTHAPMNDALVMNEAVLSDTDVGEHSDLGASPAYRWWECLGSNNLIRELRKVIPNLAPASIYAETGTAAHKLAHMCLLNGQDAIEFIDRKIAAFDPETGEVRSEHIVDDAMASAVQVYLDECRSLMKPGVQCFTERKFSLKDLDPPAPMFGTCDFGALDAQASTLTIVDYKNGAGVKVYAQGNPQLKYYAVGAICSLRDTPMPATVVCKIVQPNAPGPPVDPAVYKTTELLAWTVELLNQAEKTIHPDAPRKAGTWCRFCPAHGHCITETEAAYTYAQEEFPADTGVREQLPAPMRLPEIRLLSYQQMATMKLQFQFLRDWMNGIDKALLDGIKSGVSGIPYWDVAAGLGHRRWVDEKKTVATLLDVGLTEDEIYKRELVSPATAEKLLIQSLHAMKMKAKDAKPLAQGTLKDLTMRPDTAPALVAKGSHRPMLPGAQDEFEADLESVNQ